MKMSIKKLNIIALVLVLMLLGSYFLVRSSCGGFWRGTPITYNANREQIEAAVNEYMTRATDLSYNYTTGDVPIVNKTVIAVNGSKVVPDEDYYVIAVCPMLVDSQPRGILKNVPYDVHPRNCILEGANAEAGVVNCSEDCTGNYVWLTTINGDIASICIGGECEAHGEDGRQIPLPPSRGRIPSGAEFWLLFSLITFVVLWIAFNLYRVYRMRRAR